MNEKETWVKNFSIKNSGYHIMLSMLRDKFGLIECQKVLFGENKEPHLKECIVEFEGLDCKGAYFKEKDLIDLAQAMNALNSPKNV
jgi:hypothetical protein